MGPGVFNSDLATPGAVVEWSKIRPLQSVLLLLWELYGCLPINSRSLWVGPFAAISSPVLVSSSNSDTICIIYCFRALCFFYSDLLSLLSTHLFPGLHICPFSSF